jgi:hypothetical protein
MLFGDLTQKTHPSQLDESAPAASDINHMGNQVPEKEGAFETFDGDIIKPLISALVLKSSRP